MIDQNFIEERIKRGEQAIEKAKAALEQLTFEQFNWKPSNERWSVAECLQHLLMADKCYFKDLTEIGNGSYKMTTWEKYSPLTALLGKALKGQMKEKVKKKMVTHKILTPSTSTYNLELLNEYLDNLSKFIELVCKCRNADMDKTIINSPTITWITYSLRDALEFLFEHEHRHINQAINVIKEDKFPQ
ncbi:MAG: DinB family protein [Cyclobacteriaceae bacterium]|nr:DinB family protein [Cyclobacteriaceae bacterium]